MEVIYKSVFIKRCFIPVHPRIGQNQKKNLFSIICLQKASLPFKITRSQLKLDMDAWIRHLCLALSKSVVQFV